MKFFRKTVSLNDACGGRDERVSDFFTSSWQKGESAVPMLVVRAMLTAVAIGVLAWSLADATLAYWLIYLTNWGLIFVNATMLSSLLISILAVFSKISDDIELPWYVNMFWMIYNVTVPIAIMITILYWVLLYDSTAEKAQGYMFWLDLMTHGFNSIIVVMELLISRTPMRWTHFYQPFCVAAWYSIFTGIYYVSGGTDSNGNPYIYEVLDWRNIRRTATLTVASSFGVIGLFFVLYVMSACRDLLSKSLFRDKSQELPIAYSNAQSTNHTRMA